MLKRLDLLKRLGLPSFIYAHYEDVQEVTTALALRLKDNGGGGLRPSHEALGKSQDSNLSLPDSR